MRRYLVDSHPLRQHSPTFLAPGTSFVEDDFSTDPGRWCGGGLGMIEAHFTYCALYICHFYVSSTSDHQASEPRGSAALGHWPTSRDAQNT